MKISDIVNSIFPKTATTDLIDWDTREREILRGAVAFTARGDIHLQAGRVITEKDKEEMWNAVKDYDFKAAAFY